MHDLHENDSTIMTDDSPVPTSQIFRKSYKQLTVFSTIVPPSFLGLISSAFEYIYMSIYLSSSDPSKTSCLGSRHPSNDRMRKFILFMINIMKLVLNVALKCLVMKMETLSNPMC